MTQSNDLAPAQPAILKTTVLRAKSQSKGRKDEKPVAGTDAAERDLSELSAPLPFSFADLRAAIPNEFFQPSLPLSMYYCIRDFVFAAILFMVANRLDSFLLAHDMAWARRVMWMAYTLAQGTIFWALFCIGHDCGHGSFSSSKLVNDIIGHISHTPLLVPYHSWRISHRRHHSNTGNLDTDESWYPSSKSDYDALEEVYKVFRYELFLLLWPAYLLGARGKNANPKGGWGGSHFNPMTNLFKPHERLGVVTSSVCCFAWIGMLVWMGQVYGSGFVLRNWVGPYVVFAVWIALVTYLHHTDLSIPWYRNEEWKKLRGALSTIDRDYGALINEIHHNIGTHVVHHLFFGIPHYHLNKATEFIKPILGKYYHKSDKGIVGGLLDSRKHCRYVPDEGTAVYFVPQTKS